MLAKKALATPPGSGRTHRKNLEYLYARRSAIDSLIQSLEGYDRFRTNKYENPDRKTLDRSL